MAIAKVILNGVTQMDVTQDTVASGNLLTGYTATGADGEAVAGAYTPPQPTLETVTKTYTPSTTAVTDTITPSAGYDGIDEVDVTVCAVPMAVQSYLGLSSAYVTENNQRKWRMQATQTYTDAGYVNSGTTYSGYYYRNAIAMGTSVTPTESSQTIGGTDVMMEGAVTVNAIPSNYVGSGVTQRDSTDLSASGATVTVPSGYYASNASKSVASGTAGTPTATKSAVSNHAVTVTPSVTNSTGWITGSTKTGTAVTVSASELVSGSQTVTQNGTVDCTNLAEIVVDVQGGGGSGMTVATATATPSTASASIQFTGLSGEPTSFVVTSASDLATGASPYKTAAVVFDGTNLHGQIVTNTSNANASYSTSFTKSYSNGTLTITGTGTNFQANQYKLVYTYGGNSANLGTAETQVGSGATSVTFTGLTDEPDYFSVIFKSDFGTSSGYQRVQSVTYDGTNTYGVAMDSGAKALSSWSHTYSNGSLTVTSTGTNNGGYFHQPGYYQLTYGIGGTVEPVEITVEPLSVTQNGTYTAPTGTAYSPVTVNVSGGGSLTVATKTLTNTATTQTLSFTSLSGQPKYWFCRVTSQVSSSGSTTYYYITDLFYDGTSVKGNCFRIGSTRRIYNITSGITQSYSNGTLTITGGSSSGASPGQFYGASGIGYELIYIY